MDATSAPVLCDGSGVIVVEANAYVPRSLDECLGCAACRAELAPRPARQARDPFAGLPVATDYDPREWGF